MSDINEKNSNDLKVYKSLLLGVAGLNIGYAVAAVVGAILVFVSSESARWAESFFSITEDQLTEGISLKTMVAASAVVMVILAALMAFLILKGIKNNPKAIVAVEVLAIISLVITVIYIIFYKSSISQTVSVAIDTMTLTAADFILPEALTAKQLTVLIRKRIRRVHLPLPRKMMMTTIPERLKLRPKASTDSLMNCPERIPSS